MTSSSTRTSDLTDSELAHPASLKILISGASGLVGQALRPYLIERGHAVHQLVRRPARAGDEISWDPAAGKIDAATLEGFNAVIHLSGQNIAGGRWTPKFKEKLRDSRLQSTSLLARSLAALARRPGVLVSASAIGFYGDRAEELLTEESAPGTGFLPELCVAWESAAAPARDAGVRVVSPRIGVVLSPRGGALKPMLTPFKLGLGGVVGSGRQFWSWISLDDLLGVIEHCVIDDRMAGPVNAVAPHAVTNRQFTRTLGGVLHRPTVVPVPAWVVGVALGEMGRTLLLGSARVSPSKLQAAGFVFRHPELEGALRDILKS